MKALSISIVFIILNNSACSQLKSIFEDFDFRIYKRHSLGYTLMTHSNTKKPSHGINTSYGFISEVKIKEKNIKRVVYIDASLFFNQSFTDVGVFNAFSVDTNNTHKINVPFVHKYQVRYQLFNIGSDYYCISKDNFNYNVYVGWQLGIQNSYYVGKYEFSEYNQQMYQLEIDPNWSQLWGNKVFNMRAGLKIGGDIRIHKNLVLYFESIFSKTFKEKQIEQNVHLQNSSFINLNFGIRSYSYGY